VSARLFTALLWTATTVVLVFLLLPIAAIFLRVPPGALLDQLGGDVARDALAVTLKTNSIALALILAFGTPTAYFIATRSFRGRPFVLTLVELPLVLPPAVAGIGLLAAFGRAGLLGGELDAVGLSISFTQIAVVLAVTFVAGPFYVRPAIAAFESVDPALPAAARTLGAGPGRTFLRVALPLAGPGLGAGAALAFARGLGEFGATIMFAGNFEGRTQTLPLVVYGEFQGGDLDASIAAAAILVLAAFGVLIAVRILHWGRALDTRGLA
jgi:molybdate transport system permease protein